MVVAAAAAVAVAVVVTVMFIFMVSRTSMPKHPQSPSIHAQARITFIHGFLMFFAQFLLFFQLPEHPCPNHKNSPPRAHTVTKASMPKPEIFSLPNESSYQRIHAQTRTGNCHAKFRCVEMLTYHEKTTTVYTISQAVSQRCCTQAPLARGGWWSWKW